MIESRSELPRTELPTRLQALKFAFKVLLLRAHRGVLNTSQGLRRLPRAAEGEHPHVVVEVRAPLRTGSTDVELEIGKVHNLRLAAHRLNGTLLHPGALFSFWQQLGPASRWRGYVAGRMLQEGCLIPAVGGGLCQLSNAIYELALQADLEVVERWPHSRIVPGSAAALGRDATVAWNYVDLRLRSQRELLLELQLSDSELIARLRSRTPWAAPRRKPVLRAAAAAPKAEKAANRCDSCDAVECFRHEPRAAQASHRSAFLVAENWPEFQSYVAAQRGPRDLLGLPLDGRRWRQARYDWPTEGFAQLRSATWQTVVHSFAVRRAAPTAAAQLQLQMRASRAWARQLASALSPDITELTVAQSLLPWLWQDGHLGGRRVKVLMTRLPLHLLHARLDEAAARFPERKTLAEFRAPDFLVQAERAALEQAHIVTPHREIAALFGERASLLDWQMPALTAPVAAHPRQGCIAFAGPTVARKGAYEVAEAARRLGLRVIPLGRHLEDANFWHGVQIEAARSDWLQRVDAVVQGALVEDQPRPLLQALASGVPVIASAACGLPAHPLLTLVPPLDAEALVAALS